MLRLILGLLKGAAIGAAVGYGAFSANFTGGMHWITYGLVGALVGLLVGKPFWAHLRERGGTIFTPILKALVGAGLTIGIFAIVAKAWGGFELQIAEDTRLIYDWQHIMGAAIGAVYGAFVELDDGSGADASGEASATKKG